jgi:hypothetical protein
MVGGIRWPRHETPEWMPHATRSPLLSTRPKNCQPTNPQHRQSRARPQGNESYSNDDHRNELRFWKEWKKEKDGYEDKLVKGGLLGGFTAEGSTGHNFG